MVYFGFDLGDGESCIHWSRGMDSDVIPIPIGGYNSFISAVSEYEGRPLIGHTVLNNLSNVDGASVCFKRHFLENKPEYDAIILRFVRGVMAELRGNPDVSPFVDDEVNTCFVVGCPAGWKAEDRDRYRELMMRAGMKNVRIVSESRAAFENALKGFGREHINPDYKKQAVLVIDIGSSTLDFAYVKDGNEYEVSTLGNVMLGGGLMDEMLVMRSLEVQERSQPTDVREIRKLIEEDESKKGKLMLAVRELKEIYFNEEDFYLSSNQTLSNTKKLIGNGKVYKVELQISPAIVEDYLISRPHPLLDNRSFETSLRNSLADAYNKTTEQKEPDVVILTGGPSRMSFFVDLCRKQFRNSKILISPKPEYDISRGLVLIGKADEMMGRAIADIRRYVESDAVENMVAEMIPGLVDSIAEPLADRVMEQCVIPVFRQWKNREIETLNQFQETVGSEMEKYLRSGTMQAEMERWIQPWSDSVIDKVEADILSICNKYKVSIFLQRDRLVISAKGNSSGPVIAIDFVDMIEDIVSVVVMIFTAMICGGGGVALIASGIPGIVIGVIIAAVAIVAGEDKVDALIKDSKAFPRFTVREGSVASEKNRRKIVACIRDAFLTDEHLRRDLIDQISRAIDMALGDAADNIERAMNA